MGRIVDLVFHWLQGTGGLMRLTRRTDAAGNSSPEVSNGLTEEQRDEWNDSRSSGPDNDVLLPIQKWKRR